MASDDEFYRPSRSRRSRAPVVLRLVGPEQVRPDETTLLTARPLLRPLCTPRLSAEVRLGSPSIDHFRRRRRAGRSRRRGVLASHAWAAACLLVRQRPELFRPRVSLLGVTIADREHILSPIPLDLFSPGSIGAQSGVVLSTCPAGQDVRVEVSNDDFRPAWVAIVLIGSLP